MSITAILACKLNGLASSEAVPLGFILCIVTAACIVQLSCRFRGAEAHRELYFVFLMWRLGIFASPLVLLLYNSNMIFTMWHLGALIYFMVGNALRNLAHLPKVGSGFWSPTGTVDVLATPIVMFVGMVKELTSEDPCWEAYSLVLVFVYVTLVVIMQQGLSNAFADILVELRTTRRAVSQVVIGVCDATVTLARDLRISELTPQLCDLLGAGSPQCPTEELHGKSMRAFLSAEDASRALKALECRQDPDADRGAAGALPIELIASGQRRIPVTMFHVPMSKSRHLVALVVREDNRPNPGYTSWSSSHADSPPYWHAAMRAPVGLAAGEGPRLSSLAFGSSGMDETGSVVPGDSISVA